MKKIIALALVCALLLPLGGFASAAEEEPGAAVFHNGSPSGIAETAAGALLITDVFNKVVWQLSPGKEPEILVGRIGPADQAGVPSGGYNDSDYENAAFTMPWDITPFLAGYLVSDSENHVVRYFADGRVYTAVGSGNAGRRDGRGVATEFNYPTGLATDESGNVYIADTGNNLIRRLTPEGQVSTFAGAGSAGYADGAAKEAAFSGPTGLCWSGGALYVADTGNHVIRKIEGGLVTTFAGAVTPSGNDAHFSGDYLDGAAKDAKFSSPSGLAASGGGALYVADTGNAAVRKVENGLVSTLVEGDANAGATYPVAPRGLLFASDLYICDPFSGVVFSPKPLFSDMTHTDWFYGDVAYCVKNGLFLGTSDATFSPRAPMTRGMVVTVLGRMHGVDPADYPTPGFDDVAQGIYYAPYIEWAAENAIVDGINAGSFRPDAPVTREQLATILWRYAKFAGVDVSAGEDTNILSYPDAAQIAEYAIPALQWACAEGIVRGRDNGALDPKSGATRAEVAAMFHRFVPSL